MKPTPPMLELLLAGVTGFTSALQVLEGVVLPVVVFVVHCGAGVQVAYHADGISSFDYLSELLPLGGAIEAALAGVR